MTVIWKPTTSHTLVPSSTIVEGEIVAISYNAENELGEGQAVENPTVSLVDMQTRLEIEDGAALADTPITDNTTINLLVSGVMRGRIYELLIGFDHTNPRVDGEHTIRIHVIEGV